MATNVQENAPSAISIVMPKVPELDTIQAVKELARLAAESGMSKAKNPYDAFFIAMYGMELGIPPMTAMRTIYSVKGGAPTCSGEAMLSLLRRSGKVRVTTPDPATVKDSATATIKRLDTGEQGSYTFTMDMARKAGLVRDGSPWTSYPHMMLIWRAVSMGAKLLASDIIGGLYTVEEIYSNTPVDENGEPIGDIIVGQALAANAAPAPANITPMPGADPVTVDGVNAVFAELRVPSEADAYKPYLDALGINRFGEFAGTMRELKEKLHAIHANLNGGQPAEGQGGAMNSMGDMLTVLAAVYDGITQAEILKATQDETWEDLTKWASRDYDAAFDAICAALDAQFASEAPARPTGTRDTPFQNTWSDYDIHDIDMTCRDEYGVQPDDALNRLGTTDWRTFSSPKVAKDALRADAQQHNRPVVARTVTSTGNKNRWVLHTPIGDISMFGRDLLRAAYADTQHLATIESWKDPNQYALPVPIVVQWEQKGAYRHATSADLSLINVPF